MLDNPDLIAAAIIGDGEAETGPTAGAWHSNKFLDPATCGAVLPILHVQRLQDRQPDDLQLDVQHGADQALRGLRLAPADRRGRGPRRRHPRSGRDRARRDPRDPGRGPRRRHAARAAGVPDDRPALAQGLDGDRGARGRQDHGHRALAPGAGDAGAHEPRAPRGARGLAALLPARRSCSTEDGGPIAELVAACPTGDLRMGANPHVVGGRLRKPLNLPDPAKHAVAVNAHGSELNSALLALGHYFADVFTHERGGEELPHRLPRRGRLEPAHPGLRRREPRLHVAAGRRRRHRPRARRADHGGPLRAQLPGLAAGLRAHRPPLRVPLLRGVHPDRRRHGQPVRQVPDDVQERGAVARAGLGRELPADLRGLAPGPQRLLAPDAGLHQLHAQPQGDAVADLPAAWTPTRCW